MNSVNDHETLDFTERGAEVRALETMLTASENGVETHVAQNKKLLTAFAELQGRSDLTITDLDTAYITGTDGEVDGKKNYVSTLVHPPYNNALELMPDSIRSAWQMIDHFRGHDCRHISEIEIIHHTQKVLSVLQSLYRKQREATETQEPFCPTSERVLPASLQEFYSDVFNDLPLLLRQKTIPDRFIKALVEMDLGREPSEITTINIPAMLRGIARSLQLRFGYDDYVLTDDPSSHIGRNRIIVVDNGEEVETCEGLIQPLFQNIAKNAAKELATTIRRNDNTLYHRLQHELSGDSGTFTLDNPKTLYIKSESVKDAVLVHIYDSGEGMRTDEILAAVKKVATEDLLKAGTGVLSKRVQKILEQWGDQGNHFAMRELQLADVYSELAAIARISGETTSARTGGPKSSGLGLWGASFIREKMGARILATCPKQGGTLFTLIIPEQFPAKGKKRSTKAIVSALRRDLLTGARTVVLPNVA